MGLGLLSQWAGVPPCISTQCRTAEFYETVWSGSNSVGCGATWAGSSGSQMGSGGTGYGLMTPKIDIGKGLVAPDRLAASLQWLPGEV